MDSASSTIRAYGVLLTSAFVALLLPSCHSDPVEANDCTTELDGLCWISFGLEEEWVTTIASTPWGIFAGTADHGVFRRDTEGRWISLGPEYWYDHLFPSTLHYVPTDPPRLLVGARYRNSSKDDTTRYAIFATFDQGATWVPSSDGIPFDPENPYRVYMSNIAGDQDDPARVFAINSHGVLRSSDGGQTWNFVHGNLDLFYAGLDDIEIARDGSARVWVGGQSALFTPLVLISDDWGTTWSTSTPNCDGSVHETPIYALGLDPNVPGRLWAGGNGGVFWSDNSSNSDASWHCAKTGPQGVVNGFAAIKGTLYATTLENITVPPDGEGPPLTDLGLYRLSDENSNWEALAVPEGIAGAAEIVADEVRGRLLIGGTDGVWAIKP